MLHPSPIADYLSALGRELSFDQALSRRVLTEVEGHLWEAAEAEAGAPSVEGQRRVIAQFGDPAEIAGQFVSASLLSQARWSAGSTLLAIIGIFALMKARIVWYGLVGLQPSPYWPAAVASGLWIDRCAFFLATILALMGCGYAATCRAPARFHLDYSRQLDVCVSLCSTAAGAIIVMVLTETALACVRLASTDLRLEILIPAASMVAEIAAALLLMLHIRNMVSNKHAASRRLSEPSLPS